MATGEKWEKLLKLWKKYFRFYVVDNHDMILPSLYCFLGTVLPTKYVYGGHYNSTRFHTFFIRPSRSGKGQAIKCIYFLAHQFQNIKSFMTIKVTDAALIGTVEKNRKDEVIKISGLLADHELIAWDEGNMLLNKAPHTESLSDIIQMASDEPGYISKALRYGTLGFYTNTTFLTGSIPTSDISNAALKKGTLQRFFISYKEYTQEDILRMSRKIINLLDKEACDRDKVSNDMIAFIKGIKARQYLKIDKKDSIIINEKALDFFQSDIMNQYNDDKQNVLMSFFNGAMNLIYKVATQYAVVEEKDKVDLESLEVGYDIFIDHLNNVKRLLNSIGRIRTGARLDRTNFIIKQLRKSGGKMTRSVLLNQLKIMKENQQWDLGFNKTVTLLEDLKNAKKIDLEMEGRPGGSGSQMTVSIAKRK